MDDLASRKERFCVLARGTCRCSYHDLWTVRTAPQLAHAMPHRVGRKQAPARGRRKFGDAAVPLSPPGTFPSDELAPVTEATLEREEAKFGTDDATAVAEGAQGAVAAVYAVSSLIGLGENRQYRYKSVRRYNVRVPTRL